MYVLCRCSTLPKGIMSAQACLFLQSSSSITSISIVARLRAHAIAHTFKSGFLRFGLCPLHCPYLLDCLDALKHLSVRNCAGEMSPHTQSSQVGGTLDGLDQCEIHEEVGLEPQAGSIHLILGPMFAGKTTALLKRVQAEVRAGRNVAMVKSDKDTRYGLAAVVSHDGMQMPCWAVSSLASFRDHIGEEAYAKLDVIGIDEAQFIQDLYNFCEVAADHEGKILIVAGLDGDFLRNRFGSILELVPLADSVVKLSARCELCGKPAFFTLRKTGESKKEVIGGTDVYMPVCRWHYFRGKVAMETAQKVLKAQKFV